MQFTIKINRIRKFILLVAFTFTMTFAKAQFNYLTLGVNGLTCSACSRTVEMSIRKLDFVKDVDMNLEHTEGKIYIKEKSNVSIDKIANAVTDAGFSVRFIKASISVSNLTLNDGYCLPADHTRLQFILNSEKSVSGEVMITFLGKDFQTRKEFLRYKNLLIPKCNDSKDILYVTL